MPHHTKTCEVSDCECDVVARGYCGKHYAAMRRKGIIEPLPKVKRLCIVEGCEAKHYIKGYCAKHHRRWKLYGDPLESRRQERTPCVVEGCDSMQHAHGYCGTHLYHFNVYGDPLAKGPGQSTGRNRVGAPSYAGIHKRLFYDRGKALKFKCVDCDKQAQEWSYDGGCPNELQEVVALKPLAYSTDQSRYSPRCKRCHRAMDESLKRARDSRGRFISD